jgi:hypothetical protein
MGGKKEAAETRLLHGKSCPKNIKIIIEEKATCRLQIESHKKSKMISHAGQQGPPPSPSLLVRLTPQKYDLLVDFHKDDMSLFLHELSPK